MTLAQLDALSGVHVKAMGGKSQQEGNVSDLIALKRAANG